MDGAKSASAVIPAIETKVSLSTDVAQIISKQSLSRNP